MKNTIEVKNRSASLIRGCLVAALVFVCGCGSQKPVLGEMLPDEGGRASVGSDEIREIPLDSEDGAIDQDEIDAKVRELRTRLLKKDENDTGTVLIHPIGEKREKDPFAPADDVEKQNLEVLKDGKVVEIDGRVYKNEDVFRYWIRKNRIDIIPEFIGEMIIQQEIDKYEIPVEREEVERLVDQEVKTSEAKVKEQSGLDLETFLKQQGYPLSRMRENLARLIANRIRTEIIVRYQEMTNRQWELAMIKVSSAAKINEINEKLRRGANFEMLAKAESIDPSRMVGGRVGGFFRGDFAASGWRGLEKMIVKMNPGDISHPVTNDQGYFIFKVLQIKEPENKSLKDALPEIRESLKKKPVGNQKIEAWFARIRESAIVKRYY